MRKLLLVARYEFLRHATRKGFLFAAFGLPILIAVIFGVTIFIMVLQFSKPIGVILTADWLLDPAAYRPGESLSPILAYPDEEAARAALEEEEIQAYFIVADDYLESGRVQLVHAGNVFETARPGIRGYLRASLLARADVEPAVAGMLISGGPDFQVISAGAEEDQNRLAGFIIAFVTAMLFIFTAFSTAGYTLQAVVDEKENRTMEILVTSLSPEKLIAGKIVGLVGLGLLQIAVWATFLLIPFLIGRQFVPQLSDVAVPIDLILLAIIWFIPYYTLFAALMALIGISVTESSEGQQAAGLVTLLGAVPLWFSPLVISAPDSPLSLFLSLFPFSSPLTILLRWPMTTVPLWQLALSWLILIGTTAFSIYGVGRLLRIGMLRYGQRLSLRQIAGALRGTA